MSKNLVLAPVAALLAGALSACGGGGTPQTVPNLGNPSTQSVARQPSGTESIITAHGPVTARVVWTHIKKILPRSTTNAQPSVTVNSPFDLTYFGGPVVQHAASHAVYVNAPADTWGTAGRGTPSTFLKKIGVSNFIHVTDQYVKTTANGRYTQAFDTNVSKALAHQATFTDILSIVHTVAASRGTGYSNIYHVFLKPGQDMCIVAGECYSPDNLSTFAFCAFHSSVDFSDIGHVLFSVEPYQFVPGCTLPGTTPHGVIDASASTLGHELIETITDPDGDAWFNDLFGLEIADECVGFSTNVNADGQFYFIQSMYSNAKHACVNGV